MDTKKAQILDTQIKIIIRWLKMNNQKAKKGITMLLIRGMSIDGDDKN